MISQEKGMNLTSLQKLPNNVGNLGKLIVAKGFKKSNKSPDLVTLIRNPSAESVEDPDICFT